MGAVVAAIKSFWGRISTRFRLVGGFVLLVAAGLTVWLVHGGAGSDSSSRGHRVPFEFLYIDSTRIADYLAQLEGGQRGPAHQIKTEITKAKGQLSAAGLTFGVDAQHEDKTESSLVPTASSGLDLILNRLAEDADADQPEDGGPDRGEDTDDEKDDHRVPEVVVNGESGLDELHEDSLVKIRTHDLLSPEYIRPYVVVRTAATLAALFPFRKSDSQAKHIAKARRHKAKVFAKRVGSNPRITLDIHPPRPSGTGTGPVKIMLPIEYKNLTRERSLVEKETGHFTGGAITVVGKVVRVLHKNHGRLSAGDGFHPEFVEYATRGSWQGPLRHADKGVIGAIGHGCRIRHQGVAGEERRGGVLRDRPCLLEKLRRQTRLYAPGAVVLPIAIYK